MRSPAEIRALGFEWPHSPLLESTAVIVDDTVDLDATLARLQSTLAFYQRELDQMYAFQSKWNADWSDVSDKRGDYNVAVLDHQVAIRHVEAISSALRDAVTP